VSRRWKSAADFVGLATDNVRLSIVSAFDGNYSFRPGAAGHGADLSVRSRPESGHSQLMGVSNRSGPQKQPFVGR
jgi:hypothetical protein